MTTVRNSPASIGQEIARAREARGMNQSELARQLGVSPQAVQKWEAGTASPRPAKVAQIAQLLGLDPRALLPLAFENQGAPGHEVAKTTDHWPFRTPLARLLRMDADELERIDDFIEQSVKRWETRSRSREDAEEVITGVAGAHRLERRHKRAGK